MVNRIDKLQLELIDKKLFFAISVPNVLMNSRVLRFSFVKKSGKIKISENKNRVSSVLVHSGSLMRLCLFQPINRRATQAS